MTGNHGFGIVFIRLSRKPYMFLSPNSGTWPFLGSWTWVWTTSTVSSARLLNHYLILASSYLLGPEKFRIEQLTGASQGMREWSIITINNHPSNPQQPIHSLRLAPVRQVFRYKCYTLKTCEVDEVDLASIMMRAPCFFRASVLGKSREAGGRLNRFFSWGAVGLEVGAKPSGYIHMWDRADTCRYDIPSGELT